MKCLDSIKGVVLDMDGTFYIGERLLPGSLELLEFCKQHGLPFSFLTNNSSRGSEDYRKKLLSLGLSAEDCRVYSSGAATIAYILREFPGKTVNLMGTRSLAESFTAAGIVLQERNPDLLVLAYDTENNYPKLAEFCLQVRAGLPYIATHPDLNYPDPRGYLPDAGAFIALIQASTGRLPDLIIGKPSAEILKELAVKWGLKANELLMVGDRLYTDIQLAINAGAFSALVLTGEAARKDLNDSAPKPDFVCENLLELTQLLRHALG